jgi:thymidylate synthase (FAD)
LKIIEEQYKKIETKMDIDGVKDFSVKKKITSAMRRILPNGQANEIGFSVNLRSLRHTIVMRTSRHAEYEIRVIFNQIFNLVKDKYPAIFTDSVIEEVDGINEITFENGKI